MFSLQKTSCYVKWDLDRDIVLPAAGIGKDNVFYWKTISVDAEYHLLLFDGETDIL